VHSRARPVTLPQGWSLRGGSDAERVPAEANRVSRCCPPLLASGVGTSAGGGSMTLDEFQKVIQDPNARWRLKLPLKRDEAAAVAADRVMLESWYEWCGAQNIPAEPLRPPTVPKQPMGGFTKFLIASPFILAAAVGLGLLNSSLQSNPDRGNNEFAAAIACEDVVEKQLKSPASAEFSSVATGGGPWTVQGTVDSQNSFGALVRTTYECTVTIVDGGSTTSVTRLE
jgi:hypothetical protein